MKIPEELRFAASHEWATAPNDGIVTVGITDFAQDQLGDVVFVELPDVGRTLAAGEAAAVVESVKTASDIYAPLAGEVVEVNGALLDAPEAINTDAYGEGWLFRLRVADADAWGGMLDADAYAAVAEEG
jgi:glycine cleavage system H protein